MKIKWLMPTRPMKCNYIAHDNQSKSMKKYWLGKLSSLTGKEKWMKLTGPVTFFQILWNLSLTSINIPRLRFSHFALLTQLIRNRTSCRIIQGVIGLVISNQNRAIWNYSPHYSLSCTPFSPIPFTHWLEKREITNAFLFENVRCI